jgi:hypothetical protein
VSAPYEFEAAETHDKTPSESIGFEFDFGNYPNPLATVIGVAKTLAAGSDAGTPLTLGTPVRDGDVVTVPTSAGVAGSDYRLEVTGTDTAGNTVSLTGRLRVRT